MKIDISIQTATIIINYVNDRYDCQYAISSIERIEIEDSIMIVHMYDNHYNIPLKEL